jgi:hypothetical protein
MEICRGEFLTSALDDEVWSVLRPGRFTPRDTLLDPHLRSRSGHYEEWKVFWSCSESNPDSLSSSLVTLGLQTELSRPRNVNILLNEVFKFLTTFLEARTFK